MGESMDGDSEGMSWQDVSRKSKDRSKSTGSSTLGLEVGDMNKKNKGCGVKHEEGG